MTTLSISQFMEDPELQVELELLAGKAGLSRQITAPRIQKPGLALAGFLDLVSTSRVQIFGKTEMAYLASTGPDFGTRESRHIDSVRQLTWQDVVEGCVALVHRVTMGAPSSASAMLAAATASTAGNFLRISATSFSRLS